MPAYALTDAEAALVKKAEAYLNGIEPDEARISYYRALWHLES